MWGEIIGGLVNTVGQIQLGRENRQAQIDENTKDRQMSWDMYNQNRTDSLNAYTNLAADLERGGYNPILGYANASPQIASGSPSGGGSLPPVSADLLGSISALNSIKNANKGMQQRDRELDQGDKKIALDAIRTQNDSKRTTQEQRGTLSGIITQARDESRKFSDQWNRKPKNEYEKLIKEPIIPGFPRMR